MGHEGGVCQAGGVTGRKEVEKGISDSRMDGGPRGQQGRGTPRELYGGGCGYCREYHFWERICSREDGIGLKP